jgi:hypothetical protein
LALLSAVPALALAGVQPSDLNGDTLTQAFLDHSTGLYWSDANVFGQLSLASAEDAVGAATFEGITSWRLPTVAEFRSLYATQKHAANGNMVALPFNSVQYLWYWTAEVDPTVSTRQTAYSPGANTINFYSNSLSGNGPYTWAVASVPEPSEAILLLFGLALFIFRIRRSGLAVLPRFGA